MRKNNLPFLIGLLFISFSTVSIAQNFTLHVIYNADETMLKCIKGCKWDTLTWSNEKLQSEIFFNHLGETNKDNVKASKFLISILYKNNAYHLRGLKKTKWDKLHCIIVHPNDVFIIDKKNVQMIKYQ